MAVLITAMFALITALAILLNSAIASIGLVAAIDARRGVRISSTRVAIRSELDLVVLASSTGLGAAAFWLMILL